MKITLKRDSSYNLYGHITIDDNIDNQELMSILHTGVNVSTSAILNYILNKPKVIIYYDSMETDITYRVTTRENLMSYILYNDLSYLQMDFQHILDDILEI